jgi:predicted transcriptional regulator YdeE
MALLLATGSLLWPAIQPDEGRAPGIRHERQDTFTVVGIRVRTTNAREAGPDGEIPKLWGRAMQNGILDRIPDRADKNIIVVNSDYATDEHGEYDYTLGVRVTRADTLPEGFVAKVIVPGEYAIVRSGQGPPAQVVPAVWQRIWKMTPDQLGGHRAYKTDFEVYPQGGDPQNIQMEVYLGLRPR